MDHLQLTAYTIRNMKGAAACRQAIPHQLPMQCSRTQVRTSLSRWYTVMTEATVITLRSGVARPRTMRDLHGQIIVKGCSACQLAHCMSCSAGVQAIPACMPDYEQCLNTSMQRLHTAVAIAKVATQGQLKYFTCGCLEAARGQSKGAFTQ